MKRFDEFLISLRVSVKLFELFTLMDYSNTGTFIIISWFV